MGGLFAEYCGLHGDGGAAKGVEARPTIGSVIRRAQASHAGTVGYL